MSVYKAKKILITAGPTREYIDPVRYISNDSSGKMGYAVAELLLEMGADIYMVSGPVSLSSSLPEHRIIRVKTGKEMYHACRNLFASIDIAIFCAAVADYTPEKMFQTKIKKTDDRLCIEFIKNVDIAYEFGRIRNDEQVSVGFALETDNMLDNARAKLIRKNFDMIVINSPNEGEGFGYDTNKVSLLNKDGSIRHYSLKPKKEVAGDIIEALSRIIVSSNKKVLQSCQDHL